MQLTTDSQPTTEEQGLINAQQLPTSVLPEITWDGTCELMGLLASSVTVALGLVALVAFWRNRKKISDVLSAIIHLHNIQKTLGIRETLSKIERLSWNEKDQKPEIRMQIGALAGQFRFYSTLSPHAEEVNAQLRGLTDNFTGFTDAKKLRLVNEVRGIVEQTIISAASGEQNV